MLKCILFLLSKYYFNLASERMNEIAEKVEAGEKNVRLLMWKISEDVELGKVDKEGTLFITDEPQMFNQLCNMNFHVIALHHENNRTENFWGAKYAVEDIFALEFSSYDEAYRRLANIPWDIFETERLYVRESTIQDVEEFYRIYRNPSITYYMENLFPEQEAEIAYMKSYIEKIYGFYGFGLWTVILKETGQVIGRAGLSVREGYDLPELGFVIDEPLQKKGYGYEVCCGIIKYAKEELAFEELQALVDKNNKNSISLLEKLGFVYERDVIESERHYKLYIKTV